MKQAAYLRCFPIYRVETNDPVPDKELSVIQKRRGGMT